MAERKDHGDIDAAVVDEFELMLVRCDNGKAFLGK